MSRAFRLISGILLIFTAVLFVSCSGERATSPAETTEAVETDAPFVPDENTLGFSPGSASRQGLICSDGKGGILYQDAASGSLFHTDKDGDHTSALSERKPIFINCIGENVWFVDSDTGALCSLPLKGGEVTEIKESGCGNLFAAGGYLYFGEKGNACRMKQDGTAYETLVKNAEPVSFFDGYLYYLAQDGSLFRIEPRSRQSEQIEANAVMSVSVNEYGVFYVSPADKGFYKLKDGERTLLISGTEFHMTGGKNAYFKDTMQGIYYRIDVETAVCTQLCTFSRLYFTEKGQLMTLEEIQPFLSTAKEVSSEDGGYIYAVGEEVYIYATLAEALNRSGSAYCLTKVTENGPVIWPNP